MARRAMTGAARAVGARLRACFQSCPDLRVRAVTEPSPQAVFRHIDIHGPPPRDRLEQSAVRVPQRNLNQWKGVSDETEVEQ
jgi:hypothetical protein